MADILSTQPVKEPEVKATGPRANEVAYWNRQIKAAKDREKQYRKIAREFVNIYEAEKKQANSFNILYSNTETLQPALYNEVPRPVVQRRYKDEDPLGKLVAKTLERTLEYAIDTPDAGYDPFGSLMDAAVLSSLVPGRGVTRFNYDAEIEGEEEKEGAGKEATIAEDGASDTSGDEDGEEAEVAEAEGPAAVDMAGSGAAAPTPKVTYEAVCGETVEWDRITLGYAKRWKNVPWVAFEHRMTKQDVRATFGPQWVEKLSFAPEEKDGKESSGNETGKDARVEEVVVVQEIWHKSRKSIIFICETYADGPLKRMKDPLGLSGFYNIPEPLMLFSRVGGLVPVPLYSLYEEQAKELNTITQRINKIVAALKVRGYYDAGVADLKTLFTQDDNVLLPAKTVGAAREGATIENSIWLVPLEKLVQVLQQLYVQRQQVKQVIYEVTGISDILRGSSVASETATAQNLKNQWGTLRLKKMQKRVQRYVRDCLRICAEIIGKHFGEDTLARETGIPLQTSQQKQQAQMAFNELQQKLAMMPPPPPSGPPGAQPGTALTPGEANGAQAPQAGPPVDPAMQQMQQQLQQLQGQVSQPSWGDVLAVLKDDLQRNYKVDIETNSTVDPEAVEDKQAVGEMLQALSQVMQQMMPAAQSGVMPMPVVKSILMSVTRRFRFGPEVEDALMQMPDQMPQQGPDPKQIEQQQKQLQQKEQQLQQEEQQMQQEKAQLQMDKAMLAQQKTQQEEMLRMKEEMMKARIDIAEQKAQMKLDLETQQKELKLAEKTMAEQNAVQRKLLDGESLINQKEMQRKAAFTEQSAKLRGEQQGMQNGGANAKQLQDMAQTVMAALTDMQARMNKPRKMRASRAPDGSMIGEVIE